MAGKKAPGTTVQTKTAAEVDLEKAAGQDNLGKLMEDTNIFFQGHPAMETEETTEEREAREEREAAEAAAKKPVTEEKPPAEEETEEQRIAREAQEEADRAAAAKKVPETDEAKQAREDEAAEQRIKDAQRKMHETTEQMAEVRKQNEKLTAQIQELLVAMAKQKTEETKEVKPAAVPIETRMENTLAEIESLNIEDPDYRKKSARIWANSLASIQADKDAEIERKLNERLESEKKEREKHEKEISNQNDFYSRVNTLTKEAGLDLRPNVETDEDGKPRNSLDFDLFWRSVNNAPSTNPEDAIKWTIKEVQRIKGVVAKPIISAREKAANAQKQNAILETGAKGAENNKKEAPEEPLSISKALAMSERRIE